MRHQQTGQWAEAERLVTKIALLVTDSRLSDQSKVGCNDDVHCTPSRTRWCRDDSQTVCCRLENSYMCCIQRVAELRRRANGLFVAGLPLCIQTVLISHRCSANDDCLSRATILESWTIRVHIQRNTDSDRFLPPTLLLQAVRSHLHFSQLNAWLIRYNGVLPTANVAYRVALPGEDDRQSDSSELHCQSHCFPPCKLDRFHVLLVQKTSSVQCEDPPIVIPCPLCENMDETPARGNRLESLPSARSDDPNRKILISEGETVAVTNSPNDATNLFEQFLDKTTNELSELTAIVLPDDDEIQSDLMNEKTLGKMTTNMRTPTSFKKSFGAYERKTRNPGRNLFGRRLFTATGLPITSSPVSIIPWTVHILPVFTWKAPLKRNQLSFDFNPSLSSISNIRNAFCPDLDSASSDSDGGPSQCQSVSASWNLLGNFEESALKGRIRPFGTVDGFVLGLAASGAFHPPHRTLPVTTFFFNVSDDNAPSPYLGRCSLNPLGKRGYHLPKKGTVQVTLFNPQGTVIKMFVVRYDLLDMPSKCQTFVRQRTFFMPSNSSMRDAQNHRSWLRYLIHLRFATSKSGKLRLHTDIRMLFSRKSELDAYDLDTGSTTADTYELRSFTEMPVNPRFSSRLSKVQIMMNN